MARGTLVFKGEKPKKKKKSKSKHGKIKAESSNVASLDVADAESSSSVPAVMPPVIKPQHIKLQHKTNPEAPKLVTGSGMITTSGSVVTGHETRFDKELGANDAMVVTLPNGQQEMRVVTMRLSNTSCGLSSGFSQNLSTPTEFSILRKPRNKQREARQSQEEASKRKNEEAQQAFGTFSSNEKLVYRERTEHGSYRIKSEDVQGSTRSDLLSMRAKKTSDKYC